MKYGYAVDDVTVFSFCLFLSNSNTIVTNDKILLVELIFFYFLTITIEQTKQK